MFCSLVTGSFCYSITGIGLCTTFHNDNCTGENRTHFTPRLARNKASSIKLYNVQVKFLSLGASHDLTRLITLYDFHFNTHVSIDSISCRGIDTEKGFSVQGQYEYNTTHSTCQVQ